MNGIHEQAQEARGCLCRVLVATNYSVSSRVLGLKDRTRFQKVPGVGFKFR